MALHPEENVGRWRSTPGYTPRYLYGLQEL